MAKVNEKVLIGADEVLDRLREFPRRLQNKVVGKAMRAAAAEIRDEARRRVSVRTGALKKFIGVVTKKRVPGQGPSVMVNIRKGSLVQQVTVRVDSRGRTSIKRKLVKHGKAPKPGIFTKRVKITPRRYGHLVEFGTQAHSLRKGVSKRQAAGRLFNVLDGSRNVHPGARPRPFLAPAAMAAKEAAVVKAAMVLREGVVQEMRKK